jgi:1-acyl-sn-glycerol-3-phosphate acyltransferase
VPLDLAWGASQVYVRLVHRLRVEGAEHIAGAIAARGRERALVLVSNHTSGADPLLIQAAFPIRVRWMMMRGMMVPALDRLWNWLEIIPVGQDGRDTLALRSGLRHLRDGNVVGIFAEGGIERPYATIMPYQAGAGLLALRSGARVLPVVISGTPRSDSALAGLVRTSRAVVRFLPVRDYAKSGLDAAGIALDLEQEAARVLGWPRSGREPTDRTETGK